MSNYQQNLQRIMKYSTEIQELRDYVSNLRLPYAYFKKYNILPSNMVDIEMDKHFDYAVLVFEELHIKKNNLPFPITLYRRISHIYSRPFYEKFYEIHNLPTSLYYSSDMNFQDAILEEALIPNLEYYYNKGVITEEQLYDTINVPLKNIIGTLLMNRTYLERCVNKQVDWDQEVYDKIPADKLPVGSVIYSGCSSREDGLIVEKICPKIIKFRKHSDPQKKVQMSKEKFLGIEKYQVYCMRDREYANGVYQYKNGEVVLSTERKCNYVDKWEKK